MTDAATLGLAAVVDEGLGNSSYVLDLGDGGALVVDPPRDLRAVRAAAQHAGVRVRYVVDTHLHADFLSGAVQLAHDEGAHVLASAAGRRAFPHRGLVDGEHVDLGGLALEVVATPGHTVEHIALLLRDGSEPLGVFTGGSLIVGSAGRTDLLGDNRTAELAAAQYASLRRLAALPAATAVWPTHGAGSFCSAPPGAERTSTIGRELAGNPLLNVSGEAEFIDTLLDSLGSYPPYFRRLGEVNRRGPTLLDPTEAGQPAELPAWTVRTLRDEGALVIDVRPVPDYARGHIPGSLSIPLRAQFATWLGWLAPADTPLIIVRDAEQDPAEVMWQALKIGHDRVIGELDGGIDAWTSAGHPTTTTELITPDRLEGRRVLDIRQRPEFTGGHLPGALHIELGELATITDELPAAPVVLMCGHGERAAGAASVLERAGYRDLAVLIGGPDDWAGATGRDLATGP